MPTPPGDASRGGRSWGGGEGMAPGGGIGCALGLLGGVPFEVAGTRLTGETPVPPRHVVRARRRLVLGAGVLVGPGEVDAEGFGGVEGPVGVGEEGAGEEDGVGLAFGEDLLGVAGVEDQADGARGDVGL